jgi:long-subunit acyl-CoA synthetase (AMP-forming)
VPSLFERCAGLAPAACVLEGYGITECSPVVSVNPPAAPRHGSLGKPLPGVAVRVVDLEAGLPVAARNIPSDATKRTTPAAHSFE